MTTTRNITKQLATMEDLAQGLGEVTQSRGGDELTLHKIDTPYSVSSEAEMSALDTTLFTRARVYSSTLGHIDYTYDETRTDGIASNLSPGTWIKLNNSEDFDVLVVHPVARDTTAAIGDTVAAGTTALRDAVSAKIYLTSEAVSGEITAIDFDAGTATVGVASVTLRSKSQLITYTFAQIADVDGNAWLSIGDAVVCDDYATGNNSGILFFKVVAAGTGVADGGKYIDLPTLGLQLKQNMKLRTSIMDWGANTSNSDNNAQIEAAMAYGSPLVVPYSDGNAFLTTQLDLSNSTDIQIDGTLQLVAGEATPLISGNGISGFKIHGFGSLVGSATQSSIDTQDGDKCIYLNNCSNAVVMDITTSNTWAWSVIQTGCNNVDFVNIKASDADNQSCIGVVNGSTYANVINCRSDNSHLYGVEIESNVSHVTIIGQRSTGCVAGVSVVGADNVTIQDSFLIGNDNSNNVPPNSVLTNGMGVQIVESRKVDILNTEIKGSNRAPIFIQNGLDCTINGCDIEGYGTTQDLEGLIYAVSTGSSVYGSYDRTANLTITKNKLDCQELTSAWFIPSTYPQRITGEISGNTLKNPPAALVQYNGNMSVFDNRITTVYASNPSGAVFTQRAGGRGDYKLPQVDSVNPSQRCIFGEDTVLLGAMLTFIPETVTSSPQWFLSYNGVNYLIGLSGTGFTAGVPTTQSVTILRRYTKNTDASFSIVSTTGDNAEFMQLDLFTMKIVTDS